MKGWFWKEVVNGVQAMGAKLEARWPTAEVRAGRTTWEKGCEPLSLPLSLTLPWPLPLSLSVSGSVPVLVSVSVFVFSVAVFVFSVLVCISVCVSLSLSLRSLSLSLSIPLSLPLSSFSVSVSVLVLVLDLDCVCISACPSVLFFCLSVLVRVLRRQSCLAKNVCTLGLGSPCGILQEALLPLTPNSRPP